MWFQIVVIVLLVWILVGVNTLIQTLRALTDNAAHRWDDFNFPTEIDTGFRMVIGIAVFVVGGFMIERFWGSMF